MTENMQLKQVLDFLRFTNQFRATERAIFATGEDRMENDVEHSFQLAIFAWYVIDVCKLDIDSGLVVKYALIHDMDETFDGDIHIFDEAGRAGKEERSKKAREKIISMFPNWDGYASLVQEYQLLDNEESRFVYALDKVLPVLNIVLDEGRNWQEEETTLQKLVNNKREKVAIHPVALELWTELEQLLRDREMELFGKLS